VLFLGFLAAVGVAIWTKFRAGRGTDGGVLVAVIAAAAFGALIDWTWEIPAAFAPAVVCAGLVAASAPLPRLRRDGYWLGAATVAVAWVAMVGGALVVLSEIELQRSRDAAEADEIAAGVDRAEQARTVTPWSAEPYLQLALLAEQRGDYEGALRELRQAESRDSEDWRLPLIESRLQSERGKVGASLLALKRATNLSPMYLELIRSQG
jgi:tetratricopeptide (TPR) repeat protein